MPFADGSVLGHFSFFCLYRAFCRFAGVIATKLVAIDDDFDMGVSTTESCLRRRGTSILNFVWDIERKKKLILLKKRARG